MDWPVRKPPFSAQEFSCVRRIKRNVCHIQGLRLREPRALAEMLAELHAHVGILEGDGAHMSRKRQWQTRRFDRDLVCFVWAHLRYELMASPIPTLT